MKFILSILITGALCACDSTESKSSDEIGSDSKQSEIISEPSNGIQKDETQSIEQLSADKTTIEGSKFSKEVGSNKQTKTEKTSEKVSESNPTESPTKVEMPILDFSGVYQAILSSYVSSSGKVNYTTIKTNSQMLDQAINHYQENTPKSSWSSNQKLAYWINAYNLFTIKLIIDNYPLSSIKNIAGGKPWDKKFINLDGKTMSLNDIENGIIRKEFNEPRIHFAVNCASISCPKLLNKEYTSANLNSLLDKQAKRYINDSNENTFTANSAKISNIFDWYKSDFDGGVIPFLNKYLDNPLPENAKITYEEYNWNLNN